MRSGDKDNYGTPFSYATINQDNEVLESYLQIRSLTLKVHENTTTSFIHSFIQNLIEIVEKYFK